MLEQCSLVVTVKILGSCARLPMFTPRLRCLLAELCRPTSLGLDADNNDKN